MNKKEFSARIAKIRGRTQKDAEKDVQAVLDLIEDSMADGEKISFVGFGSFEAKPTAARKGINPRTKETIDIPASKSPKFKAGKILKQHIKSTVKK